jgi:hypothetical protein
MLTTALACCSGTDSVVSTRPPQGSSALPGSRNCLPSLQKVTISVRSLHTTAAAEAEALSLYLAAAISTMTLSSLGRKLRVRYCCLQLTCLTGLRLSKLAHPSSSAGAASLVSRTAPWQVCCTA